MKAGSPAYMPFMHQQQRYIHVSRKQESVMLIYGGVLLTTTALAAQQGLRLWKDYQEKKKNDPAYIAEQAAVGPDDGKKMSFTESLFAKRFYEGGFEGKMTRREAALILGVRESASAQRIRDAHRRILMINHPDTGGSTFIASKVNEAKELLLKGKE